MTQSITTRPPESDPNASAVEALLARFPDLDRSHATEVVAWCADDGAFPEGSTLFSSDHEEAYSRGASSDLTVPVPALLGVTVTVPPFPSDPPMDVRDSELWGLAPRVVPPSLAVRSSDPPMDVRDSELWDLAPRVVPPSLAVRASEPPMDVRDSELWDLAPRVVSPPSLAVRSSEPPMDVRDSQLRDLAARELSELSIDVTVSDAPEENELAIDVTMSVAPQENEPVIDVTVSDAPAPHDGLLETSGVGDARSDDEGAASPWFVAPAPYEPRVAATIPPPSMESMAAEEAVAAVSEGTLLAASVHGDSDPLARITVSVDSFPSVEGEPGAPIRVALRPVRRGRAGVALGVLVVTNSALAAGVLGVRAESHRDRVPVAALSAEVSDLHRESAATRAKLDETRTTLDEHAGSIAKTMAAVAATDERLNTNEREAKEHEAREQREISTLSSRMTRTEHRAEVQYSLLEALALIDGVKKPSPVTPSAPKGPIGEPASAAVRAVIDH